MYYHYHLYGVTCLEGVAYFILIMEHYFDPSHGPTVTVVFCIEVDV